MWGGILVLPLFLLSQTNNKTPRKKMKKGFKKEHRPIIESGQYKLLDNWDNELDGEYFMTWLYIDDGDNSDIHKREVWLNDYIKLMKERNGNN